MIHNTYLDLIVFKWNSFICFIMDHSTTIITSFLCFELHHCLNVHCQCHYCHYHHFHYHHHHHWTLSVGMRPSLECIEVEKASRKSWLSYCRWLPKWTHFPCVSWREILHQMTCPRVCHMVETGARLFRSTFVGHAVKDHAAKQVLEFSRSWKNQR